MIILSWSLIFYGENNKSNLNILECDIIKSGRGDLWKDMHVPERRLWLRLCISSPLGNLSWMQLTHWDPQGFLYSTCSGKNKWRWGWWESKANTGVYTVYLLQRAIQWMMAGESRAGFPILPICAILCLLAQSCSALCDPMDCSPSRFLCPWGFFRQEYRSG